MTISQNIAGLKNRIESATEQSKRSPDSVLLLAVSKGQNYESIAEAYQQGVRNFGENYYQEALDKILKLQNLPIEWHFIGPIQSNKAKGIAEHFSWVHSVSRYKIAGLLNEYRPPYLEPLNVCIQVSLVPEETKSGIPVDEVESLAHEISKLPNIRLRGLMTIPPPPTSEQTQYKIFLRLKELMDTINRKLDKPMDTLSMGMSDDLLPAIQAGSTIVRIGRAIFGERIGKKT
ncbi:YggS family pyridoxal phosphate-dependent enzyme [Legionella waltersii]|nr:YggS family pyridoxal phosphate-dependent enzyme [Legionella waltersii]